MQFWTTFKWTRILIAVLLLSALVLAACGDDDDDDTGDNGAATSEEGGDTPTESASTEEEGSGGDASAGGELTVQYLEFQSFDPHFSSFAQDIGHEGMVFRGLYKLDKENKPQPEMADGEPEISEDGKTVTVKIKDGLTWSDGDDLKAEDFVMGVLRTCNPDNAGQYQYLLSNIVGCDDYYGATDASADEKEQLKNAVGVRAVDDLTVEYSLQNPGPTFPIILSLWMTYPVPVHIAGLDDPGAQWPTDPTQLVFNGPFVVDSYTASDNIVFTRNESFGGAKKANLDKVTFRYIEDDVVSNNAYRSGELDIARADPANLEQLKNEFPDNLLSQPGASIISLEVQMENEALGNEQVRLALSKAIDRDALTNVVLQGASIGTTTWIPPDVLGGDASTEMFKDQIGYDPEGAKKALADAGYPNGEGFPELSILIRDTEENRKVSQFLQGQFNEILGITTTIEVVDAPVRSQRFTDEQFELFPGGWIQDYPDPENWIIGLFNTEGTLNHYNCSDPEIDALIEEAQYNPDNDERLDQYRQINELINTRLCGQIPMYHRGNHYLIADRVGGAEEMSTSQNRVLAGDWSPEDWSIEE